MNAHRARWIGRAGTPGRWCRTCWTFAATVKAQQVHAELHEPRAYLDARGLAVGLDWGES